MEVKNKITYLEEIFGETLPLATNTVYLGATDEEGNESEVVSFEETLELEEDLLGPEVQALAAIYGLDAYPDAITLPAIGTRSLSVKIDFQSVSTVYDSHECGIDGNKKMKSRKRHIVVT